MTSSCEVGGNRCQVSVIHEAVAACGHENRCVVTAQRHAVPVQGQCWSLAPVADTAMCVVCGFDSYVIDHPRPNMEAFLRNRGVAPTRVRLESYPVGLLR